MEKFLISKNLLTPEGMCIASVNKNFIVGTKAKVYQYATGGSTPLQRVEAGKILPADTPFIFETTPNTDIEVVTTTKPTDYTNNHELVPISDYDNTSGNGKCYGYQGGYKTGVLVTLRDEDGGSQEIRNTVDYIFVDSQDNALEIISGQPFSGMQMLKDLTQEDVVENKIVALSQELKNQYNGEGIATQPAVPSVTTEQNGFVFHQLENNIEVDGNAEVYVFIGTKFVHVANGTKLAKGMVVLFKSEPNKKIVLKTITETPTVPEPYSKNRLLPITEFKANITDSYFGFVSGSFQRLNNESKNQSAICIKGKDNDLYYKSGQTISDMLGINRKKYIMRGKEEYNDGSKSWFVISTVFPFNALIPKLFECGIIEEKPTVGQPIKVKWYTDMNVVPANTPVLLKTKDRKFAIEEAGSNERLIDVSKNLLEIMPNTSDAVKQNYYYVKGSLRLGSNPGTDSQTDIGIRKNKVNMPPKQGPNEGQEGHENPGQEGQGHDQSSEENQNSYNPSTNRKNFDDYTDEEIMSLLRKNNFFNYLQIGQYLRDMNNEENLRKFYKEFGLYCNTYDMFVFWNWLDKKFVQKP